MPLTPEQLEKIQNQSAARKARAKEISDRQKPAYSTVYIPEQNIFVRFYTDCEAEYQRSIYRHKFEKLHGQCLGPRECEICHFLYSLPEWDAQWRFGARQIDICYAWIDEYTGSESQYVKVREPILLMGNYKLGKSLSEFIADLGDADALQEFFNPEAPYFRTRLHLRDKGKDFDFGVIPTKRITMPLLPEAFPSLSQCIYRPDQKPSHEMIEKFKHEISESFEAAQKKVSEPPSSSQSSEPAPWDDEESTGAVKEGSEQPALCPGGFGKKPERFNPLCVACVVEESCAEATKAAKK